MSGYKITKTFDWSMGHTLTGHKDLSDPNKPGKCSHLHGHTYQAEIELISLTLDNFGMVLDFGHIKNSIKKWIDDNWDHRLLIWDQDGRTKNLKEMDPGSIVVVAFNPSAENLAAHIYMKVLDLLELPGMVHLSRVRVWETPTSYAEYSL